MAADLLPAEAAPLFAALGDETRLRLVSVLLASGPRSLSQLTGGTGVTRQAVSKHLRVLERAGLVASTRLGRERRYRAEPRGLVAARNHLERAAAQWDDALGRLRDHLREDPG